MWEHLLEKCASLLGLTAKTSKAPLVLASVALGVFSLITLELWGSSGLYLTAGALLFTFLAGLYVVDAREALWRAVNLSLEDPRQIPRDLGAFLERLPVTAQTLRRLGSALDDARRGRYALANAALPRIDRALLRPEELRLFNALRAMISLGLGDLSNAAQLAAAALPTGSEELDTQLGRAVITEAWHQPQRLRAIHTAWSSAGIAADHEGTLSRLHRLTRLRIDERLLETVDVIEARALSHEAREIGDEDLASDLEARARARAYR